MTLQNLISYLNEGREIEFSLDKNMFFLAPLYSDEGVLQSYYIYCENTKKDIIVGTLEEILSYEFIPQVSLKSSIDLFSFDFIL